MGHQTAPILNPALRHVALHSIARQRREGKKLKTASLELFRSNSLLCNLQATNLLQFLTQRKGMLLFVPSRVKGVQAVKLRLPAWSYFTPIRSCGTQTAPNSDPARRHVALHSIARLSCAGKAASLELCRSNSLLWNLWATKQHQFHTQRNCIASFAICPYNVFGMQGDSWLAGWL